jgi:long-chain fatty acid transport protein
MLVIRLESVEAFVSSHEFKKGDRTMKGLFIIAVCFMLVPSSALAVGSAGFGNEVVGAHALGQGGVGVANAHSPETLYLNPATLSDLPGLEATYGFSVLDNHAKHESASGSEEKIRPLTVAVPNFSFTSSGWFDNRLSFGLATQSPYGSETHWSDTGFSRYLSTNARLRVLVINPAVAVKIHPDISLGAGADYLDILGVSQERLSNGAVLETGLMQATGASGSPSSASDIGVRQRASGSNWTWNAGLLYHPSQFPNHSLGVAYRPKTTVRVAGGTQLSGITGPLSQSVFGGSTYEVGSHTDIFFPQTISVGYAWRAQPHLTFELDWAWADWTSMNDTNVRFAETNPLRSAVLNTGNPVKRDWRTTNNLALGADYKITDHFSVRTGYYYIPWVVPESTFSSGIVDLSRHGLTVGTGYVFGHYSIDLAYNAIFQHSRSINNSVGTTTTGVPGTADAGGSYTNFVNLIALNVTAKF